MDNPETNFEPNEQDKILHLHIADRASLHAAYMPFLKNGGLYVETSRTHNLRDEVCLQVSFLSEPEKICIHGKIAWITPEHTQPNQIRGLGIAFNEEDGTWLKHKIESYLSDYKPKQKRTHTL